MISAVPIGYWFMICSGLIVVFMSAVSWNKYSNALDYPAANCSVMGNFTIDCLGPLCSCTMTSNYVWLGGSGPEVIGTVLLKNPLVSPLCLTATQCHKWRDGLTGTVLCHIKKPINSTIGYTVLDNSPIYIAFTIGITLLFLGLMTAGIYHSHNRRQTWNKSYNYVAIQASA